MTDIDLERIPHEVSRSMLLDHGVWPEQVAPGLNAFPDGDNVVFKDTTDTIVATVPTYRLEQVDIDYLAERMAAEATPDEGTKTAQAIEALRSGHFIDDPEYDFLAIVFGGGPGFLSTYLAPRAWAVPDWPDDELPDKDTAQAIAQAWASSLDLPPHGMQDGV